MKAKFNRQFKRCLLLMCLLPSEVLDSALISALFFRACRWKKK